MKKRGKPLSGAECCVRLEDGSLSAYPLQEQMIEGVDDSDIRIETRKALIEAGLDPQELDLLFPDLPPSVG
jgi:hypothetical protein